LLFIFVFSLYTSSNHCQLSHHPAKKLYTIQF